MKITRSLFQCEGLELRDDGEGKKKTLSGYAAKFEKLSEPLYGFKEKIRRGAFSESLKSNNIRALWNHNTDWVLGNTKTGTLRLKEDDTGLKFEIDLPDTTVGRDAGVSVSRGDVDGMSFAFETRKQEWDEKNPNNVVRTLIDVDLKEISPTAFPAYPQTKVTARSVKDDYEDHSEEIKAEEEKENQRQIEINQLELRKSITTLKEKECI